MNVVEPDNPPAPSAYFKLEGYVANELVDEIGGRNFTKGTVDGTFAAGKSGNGWSGASQFSGENATTTDTFYNINSLAIGFTLRLWIKKDALTINDWGSPIRTDNGFGGFNVDVWFDGTVRFILMNAAGGYAVASQVLPSFGVFHHIMCYWDKAAGKIGIKINDAPATESVLVSVYATPGTIKRLGQTYIAVPPITGQFDEIAWWKEVVLTPAQMTADYNSGTGLFWPW